MYCTEKLFHTTSDLYRDHSFPCCGTHASESIFDICVAIDCTGSMGSYFPEVKKTVRAIVEKYNATEASTRFSIIGYTDHGSSASYPDHRPIGVYPPSKDLESSSIEGVFSFIDNLSAGGGGDAPEAMIDALDETTKLIWRDGNKIVYVVADCGAHGKDLTPSADSYPEGCPCKLNWRSVLENMKSKNIGLRFAKVANHVETTISAFKTVYTGIEVMDLSAAPHEQLSVFMVSDISSTIDTGLELSEVPTSMSLI